MGLGFFREEDRGNEVTKREFKAHHGNQDANERLWNLMEDVQEDIEPDIEVGFIEVSPQMETTAGRAFKRYHNGKVHYFIRMAGWMMEKDDKALKGCIAHELIHILFWHMGWNEKTERDELFTYALGMVGAHLSGYNYKGSELQKVQKSLGGSYGAAKK